MSTLIRWNPFREMAAMQSAVDRLFESAWRNVQPTLNGNVFPVDVHETDTQYTVIAVVPGLPAEDIHVSWHDGVLTISGQLPQPQIAEGTRVLLAENFYGNFSRSLTLPVPIDPDKVEAQYQNGVLTLTLPKVAEAQPRLIPVKTNGRHN